MFLTDRELEICTALNVSPARYLREKVRRRLFGERRYHERANALTPWRYVLLVRQVLRLRGYRFKAMVVSLSV